MEEWRILHMEGFITIGPPTQCARQDITVPVYLKTKVIIIGKMSQPSYLPEIPIWLVLGYLRLKMSEKKNEDVRFSGYELHK